MLKKMRGKMEFSLLAVNQAIPILLILEYNQESQAVLVRTGPGIIFHANTFSLYS